MSVAHPTTLGNWHRNSNGNLERGQLVSTPCHVRFRIYTPDDLNACPHIGILCVGGPHAHAAPSPHKTPLAIRGVFEDLLRSLNWRLANATPRRVLRDEVFIAGLRRVLGLPEGHEPHLVDLHPSFANMEHVSWIISPIKDERYPHGTDFEGGQAVLFYANILGLTINHVTGSGCPTSQGA